MKVFVIIGNDFPDAVFRSKKSADEYIAVRNAEQAERKKREKHTATIYWRSYDFELKQ